MQWWRVAGICLLGAALLPFFQEFEGLSGFSSAEAGKSLPWNRQNGRPRLLLSQAQKLLGLRAYYDKSKERVLIEGKGKFAFFLPWSSYAVVGGMFQQISTPIEPALEAGDFYFDASLLQTHLLDFVPEKNRNWLRQEIQKVLVSNENAVCALERPVKRIFIDPGHGGEDHGAKRGGSLEKKIVLDFSKLAAKELKAMGMEVMLSREVDVLVPLDLRPHLASEWRADVFISVHANAFKRGGIRGPETYILSSDATNAEARKLALLENKFVEEKLTKRSRKQRILDTILWDVGQTAYLQDSAYLASAVHTELYKAGSTLIQKKEKRKWVNRGVLQAPFLVLKQAAMPAVLLEIGYLSNANDRKWLNSKKFQQNLAKALAKGVKKYAEHCQRK